MSHFVFADPTPETEARQHLLATVKSKSETLSLEGRRLVSDEVWNLLQQEVFFHPFFSPKFWSRNYMFYPIGLD